MKFLRNLLIAVVIVAAFGIAAAFLFIEPDPQFAGDPYTLNPISELPTPPEELSERSVRHSDGENIADEKQILFGDMHLHTTYSVDAFNWSLPIMLGTRGAMPPSEACDYARYVSQLDFYFLTDHAEAYTPEIWNKQVQSVRQCNAVANSETPDLMAFIGWEWTQIGITAEEHFGHHNVFFKDIEKGQIPSRPIGAAGQTATATRSLDRKYPPRFMLGNFKNRSYLQAFNDFVEEMAATPNCEEGVHARELPEDCFDSAATPAGLLKKLRQWGFDTIVAPHGTTWGFYTPPNANWSHQLKPEHHDSEMVPLIEVYSGHGNSEIYRDFRARHFDEIGQAVCPQPSEDYLPSCWQAGVIIRDRCLEAGESEAECDKRAAEARRNYVEVDTTAGFHAVPGAEVEDWLDSGQLRGGFLPAFNYRPGKSVQYGLALRNFEDPDNPLGYRWGFIASTDNHTARPGTGFKQYDRIQATEANGVINDQWRRRILTERVYDEEPARSVDVPEDMTVANYAFNAMEAERLASFFTLGGIVAVHADSRSRDGVWDALKRKEVYGTSGPRILLWFDLLNPPGKEGELKAPMGSELAMEESPRFRVRAVGSFEQKPGCPDYVKKALAEKRLERLASGECYNPGDRRKVIERIEVIRIRPQQYEGEPVAPLIEDVWLSLDCPGVEAGCEVEFADADYEKAGRDTVYYVRAIEEPTPTVNGNNLRPVYDENGNVIDINPCYGDWRTDPEDECLASVNHRAWSSPIYVDFIGKHPGQPEEAGL